MYIVHDNKLQYAVLTAQYERGSHGDYGGLRAAGESRKLVVVVHSILEEERDCDIHQLRGMNQDKVY